MNLPVETTTTFLRELVKFQGAKDRSIPHYRQS